MTAAVIGIVFNEPRIEGNSFSASSADVLQQVEAIEKSLDSLGHPHRRIPFTRDVASFLSRLKNDAVSMIYNLCETVDEDARLAGHPAALFELLGLPFTGSPSCAIMNATDKITTKRLLRAAGINTPSYLIYDGAACFPIKALRYPVIIKPRYEDASIGIDQESICSDEGSLAARLRERYNIFGTLIVEEFIAGREFNVSLFGYPTPTVLPIAEIDFSAFPDDLYPIVGYSAKWEPDSVEYRRTPRVFPSSLLPHVDGALRRIAAECFRQFMLRDFGRIDFRIDKNGRPSVLEVNANPCLSPDAGFPAAARQEGIEYEEMVSLMLQFMKGRS